MVNLALPVQNWKKIKNTKNTHTQIKNSKKVVGLYRKIKNFKQKNVRYLTCVYFKWSIQKLKQSDNWNLYC